TRNFFNIIGLSPQIGRVFSENEDKVGALPVAVISDRIWQRVFNRSPKAVGQSIVLHDQNFTIIGVMPPQMTSPQDTDVWVSLMRRSNNPAWIDRSHHPMMFVWGRLKVGVTVDQARSEMKTIAAQLEKAYPETNKGETIVVTPLLENLVGKYRTNLGLLLGAVGWVLLFTLVVASVTAVLFGLWPAWQSSRADVQLALKAGSQGSGDAPSAKRMRDWLVISQIALTLTLLIAAALVLKSFSRLQALSLGYEPRGMLTARLEMPWRTYNTRDKIDMFAKTLLDKVRTLPGVQSAGLSSNGPLMGGWQTGFWREGTPQPTAADMLSADLEVVAGDYFSTFKAPLLRGRTLNERDAKDSPRVIVVDQAMADKYFPGEDPIGKRLMVDAGNDEEGNVASEIVGVVVPMRFHAIDEMAPLPVIYCSLGQAQRTSLTLFVRSTSGLVTLERPIRDAISSIDPALPLFDVRPMTDRVQETWGTQRLLSLLFSVFAGLALTLATIGLYGLLAYTTLKRVREIGVRLALGARPSQILTLILSHGMQLLLVGSAIGLVGAIAVSHFLQRLLFEASGIDPRIYLEVGAVLLSATFLACWIPARRASRVDPIVALRME